MTGFGKASRQLNGVTITVEIGSVNHRYLDASLRIPYEWSALEHEIREALNQAISRGKITLSVNRKRGAVSAHTVKFAPDVARKYIEAGMEMGHMLGHYEPLTVNTLAQLEGVFFFEEDQDELGRVRETLFEAMREAIEQLNAMRVTEGNALARDVHHRVELLRAATSSIETRLPELNALQQERLRARLLELNADASVTEERLAIELALLAEKGDVTEEVVRLKSHFDHAVELFDGPEPAGRKLNFLLQEMQREINTLGSKVRDTTVGREVLHMKSELEKIREQIQNVE